MDKDVASFSALSHRKCSIYKSFFVFVLTSAVFSLEKSAGHLAGLISKDRVQPLDHVSLVH